MIRGFVLFCCIYLFSCAIAMTPEQKAMVHEHFENLGRECIKDNVISEEDITNLRSRKLPSGENAPCFLACVMKKTGMMDDQGMMQKENILEMAKTVFNDEEEIKLIGDYLHSCSHVNTASVTDGEKGCERAIIGYKCMLENAPQFGFDI